MNHTNCPTCGAKTSAAIANCEYCGVEIKKADQLTPKDYISALAHSIDEYKRKARSSDDTYNEAIDGEKATANAIGMFPIPSDVSLLTEFFMFCHGNVKEGFEGMQADNKAWRAKAKAAYDKLRLASLNNPQISSFLDDFKAYYSSEAMKKDARNTWLVMGIAGGALLLIVVLSIIFGS